MASAMETLKYVGTNLKTVGMWVFANFSGDLKKVGYTLFQGVRVTVKNCIFKYWVIIINYMLPT